MLYAEMEDIARRRAEAAAEARARDGMDSFPVAEPETAQTVEDEAIEKVDGILRQRAQEEMRAVAAAQAEDQVGANRAA